MQSDAKVENLLSAFAAATRDGLVMAVGEGSAIYAKAILSGMSVMSKLVINVARKPLSSAVYSDIHHSDIRAAVHYQEPMEFLDDVSHHRLDLAVLSAQDAHPALVAKLSDMLRVGGMLIVLSSPSHTHERFLQNARNFKYAGLEVCSIYVKSSEEQRTRRGGRAAKRSMRA